MEQDRLLAMGCHRLNARSLPYPGSLDGASHPLKELALQRSVIKETPACARVTDPNFTFQDPEAFSCRIRLAADHNDCSRSHVLLLADDLVHALVKVVRECFFGVLQ